MVRIRRRLILDCGISNDNISDIRLTTPEEKARQEISKAVVHANLFSFDPEPRQRAETRVTSFRRRNVSGTALAAGENHKDEIEAISILYSRPYSAGLRYGQVKELARCLSIKPFHIDESQPQTLLRLWQAFGTVAPDKVDTGSGTHYKHIVDFVSLVRHAIDPESPLRPVGQTVEERFAEWLSEQQQTGGEFTEEQMQRLLAIKDHIASSLMIEQDDFEYAPFNQFGGIGRAYELFGDRLAEIMEELNARFLLAKFNPVIFGKVAYSGPDVTRRSPIPDVLASGLDNQQLFSTILN